MEFQALVAKIGIELAVVTRYKNGSLSKEIMESLSFSEWCRVGELSSDESDLKAIVLAQMSKKAETFDQWLIVCRFSSARTRAHLLSLQKMCECADTFEHWFRVYREASMRSKYRSRAFREMADAELSFDDWKRVFERSYADSKLRSMALRKMCERANTVVQYLTIFSRVPKGGRFWSLAERRMRKSDWCLSSWLELYVTAHHYSDNSELLSLAERKICEVDKPFKWFQKVYHRTPERSSLRRRVLEKMGMLAETFYEWSVVCEWASHNGQRELNLKALEKMQALAETADQWSTVYYDSLVGSDARELALTRIREADLPLNQWMKMIRRGSRRDEELRLIVIQKITPIRGTMHQWHTLYKREWEGSELQLLALSKMAELDRAE